MYKLYGLFRFIISDRDIRFVFRFWIVLYVMLQIKIKLFTVYYSETDGVTERSN